MLRVRNSGKRWNQSGGTFRIKDLFFRQARLFFFPEGISRLWATPLLFVSE